MPIPTMPTQVSCPQCGQKFVVQIRTIIDVGDDPNLKEEFLRGKINYAKCPQCEGGGVLSAPLLYHDPEKELLVSYMPAELGMSADQQEQYVGSLVQIVMNNLPAEGRKGYFLQPKTALTLESLYDMILEADGISLEVLESQRQRLRLVSELLAVMDDEEALAKAIETHRDDLDYTFFLLLSDAIGASEERGGERDLDDAKRLERLRNELLERVNPKMPSALPPDATYDDLIEMLRDEDEASWYTTIALNQQRLDYGFFQALTAKIEAAQGHGDTEQAEELVALRDNILQTIDDLNESIRQTEDQASLLIMQISEADNIDAAIREHKDEIDEIFLTVLSRLMAAAQRSENADRSKKLRAIQAATAAVLEEALPPNWRLVNQLLRAESLDDTSRLLEANRGMLTDEFLQAYDQYAEQLGQPEGSEINERFKQVRNQIKAKMTIQRL